MKSLNTICFLLTAYIVVSCSSSNSDSKPVENANKVTLKNGNNEEKQFDLNCLGCSDISNSKVKDLVIKTNKELTDLLYVPDSYIPDRVETTVIKIDTAKHYKTNEPIKDLIQVLIKIDYTSENRLGKKLSGDFINTYFLINGEIDFEVENNIKLPELKFEENETYDKNGNSSIEKKINRQLIGYHGDESIRIYPVDDNYIGFNTTLGCIDYKDVFKITLDNDKDINLETANEFNCEGGGLVKLSDKVFEILKNNPVKYIYLNNGSKSLMIALKNNESDYFQQLAELLNK